MAETAENFQWWLDAFLLEAGKTALKICDIARGYPAPLYGMKSPGEIADNCAQREILMAERNSKLERQ
ncbi:hypothetical protein [Mycobacterium lepromatosis]|uniref:hypothetical protein n=1 Tax=Mycobacterium lepromatosis TaxID=480418 RepID=UPI0005F7E463